LRKQQAGVVATIAFFEVRQSTACAGWRCSEFDALLNKTCGHSDSSIVLLAARLQARPTLVRNSRHRASMISLPALSRT
jgi:hypothetical protein